MDVSKQVREFQNKLYGTAYSSVISLRIVSWNRVPDKKGIGVLTYNPIA